MTEAPQQQQVLQDISDEWKHRDDAPKAAKTGRGKRSGGSTKAKATTHAAATAVDDVTGGDEHKEDAHKA